MNNSLISNSFRCSKIFLLQCHTNKVSSRKIEQFLKSSLGWHSTLAALGQAYFANNPNISSPYNTNTLFHRNSKNKWALNEVSDSTGTLRLGVQSSLWSYSIVSLQMALIAAVIAFLSGIVSELLSRTLCLKLIQVCGFQVRWIWRLLRVTPGDSQSAREMLL